MAEGKRVHDRDRKRELRKDPAYREREATYRRELYDRRIDHGICVNCPAPSAEGRVRCERCLERKREYDLEYRAQGLAAMADARYRQRKLRERMSLSAVNDGLGW